MGQVFPTASSHRDHSIGYALVCEKEISHMCKSSGNFNLACKEILYCVEFFLLFVVLLVYLCYCFSSSWYQSWDSDLYSQTFIRGTPFGKPKTVYYTQVAVLSRVHQKNCHVEGLLSIILIKSSYLRRTYLCV